MQTGIRLIQRLSDGRFHSGETLARELGISRAAVWKRIKAIGRLLETEIHAVPGRGYRLARPLELFEVSRVRSALSAERETWLADLALFHRIESTNAYLLARAAEGARSGSACLAEQQSAGRGRRGRPWVSPFGTNIYLSLLWRYPLAPQELGGLSLAAGLGVLRALRNLGVEGLAIKWPNDLLHDGKKLAGLLLEITGESAGSSCVVVGVGINTSMGERQGNAIDQPWTDLGRVPGGEALSRNRVAGAVLDELLGTLAGFESQGLAPLIPEWHRFDPYLGKSVALVSGERRIQGIHQGIDPSGALLLDHAGTVRAYHAGELSLRRDRVGQA